MDKMGLKDIKISEAFAKSVPGKAKMDECRRYWKENHCQDRFLVVNHNNVLVDGYIQYLVLQENGIKDAEVKFSDKKNLCWYRKDTLCPSYMSERTTYIYGKHLTGGNRDKEYMWRVPKAWTQFTEDVSVGDRILCNTCFGTAPVVVTRVRIANKCPITAKVKRVAKKEIIRNGIAMRKDGSACQ